ncbi:MAG: TonB C-terminal domain-containing protein [Pseudomonadota bacterium]|nr:TonB C-terminal domain-containing protein [Pseudomonadota bacterium]
MRWVAAAPHIGAPALRRAAALGFAVLAVGSPVSAQELPPVTPAPVEQGYDIPAQPVSAALASYARVSGVDIFYENALAGGRMSSPVRGAMSPQAALRALLLGTGLSARFTEPKAAIVFLTAGPPPRAVADASGLPELRLGMAEVRAPPVIGTPDRSDYQRYAQAVQLDIRRLLSEDPDLRGRVFRLQVSLKVAPGGAIERVVLLRGSGDDARDAHIRRILLGGTLAPPPAGLREPLYFEVVTDRLGGRG